MLLLALSCLSTAWAQTSTVTATGAVSWNAAGTWSGGIPGISTTAINIRTAAQVYLNSTLLPFTIAPALGFGAAGTAGTALVIQGVSLTVAAMSWDNGQVQISGAGGELRVGSVSLAAGANLDRQIVGGKFALSALAGSASLAGQLSCTGCTLDSNDKVWDLNAGAFVFANASAMSSGAVFGGTGSVSVAAGASVAIATSRALVLRSGVTAQIDGSIDLAGDASFDAAGAVVVGATGAITGSAQAIAAFHANTSASLTLNGGANLRGGTIAVDGVLAVNTQAGTTAVVVSGQGTTTIAGTGSVNVRGRFDANSAVTVTTDTFAVGAKGDFRIAGGVQASFRNISFDSDSDWYLSFPSSGAFTAVTVSGRVTLGGRFHLQLPDPLPTGTVRLVTAASITGTFNGQAMLTTSAGAGRRLLDQGSVTVTGNSIDYTRSGAASYGFMGLVAAFVLALF